MCNDAFPDQIQEKAKSCFYAIFDIAKEVKIYTYLTGKIHNQSSRRHNHICVAYNYDANAILVEVIPNRETDTILSALKSIHS